MISFTGKSISSNFFFFFNRNTSTLLRLFEFSMRLIHFTFFFYWDLHFLPYRYNGVESSRPTLGRSTCAVAGSATAVHRAVLRHRETLTLLRSTDPASGCNAAAVNVARTYASVCRGAYAPLDNNSLYGLRLRYSRKIVIASLSLCLFFAPQARISTLRH